MRCSVRRVRPGLTLYEMVALRPAFDQAARQALIRQVMEAEPPRLRTISPDVPRDLEMVIQKAIVREPAGRYATAGALAADLALFLDGKPVRARDAGIVERCWKWAKRRPAIAALLFGLAVTALTGVTAVTWQWRAAVAARDEARQALKMANEAVNTSYKVVSEDYLLNEPGMQPLREKLLKLSLPFYKTFAEQKANDPALKVQLANVFFRWGTITGEIGSKEESKRILSTAIGHFKALLRADSTNLEVRIGLARCTQALALEAVRTNQPEEGSQTARLAAELWADVVRARPNDPEPRRCLGRSHDIAGWARAEAGDNVGARREFETAVLVLSDAADRSPTDFETRRAVARALDNLGVFGKRTTWPQPSGPIKRLANCSPHSSKSDRPVRSCGKRWPRRCDFLGRFICCSVPSARRKPTSHKAAQSLRAWSEITPRSSNIVSSTGRSTITSARSWSSKGGRPGPEPSSSRRSPWSRNCSGSTPPQPSSRCASPSPTPSSSVSKGRPIMSTAQKVLARKRLSLRIRNDANRCRT